MHELVENFNYKFETGTFKSILINASRSYSPNLCNILDANGTNQKTFATHTKNSNTMKINIISHKETAKYLRVKIDYLLKVNHHVTIQLKRARTAFYAHGCLFHSKHMSWKIKIIYFPLLIHSILPCRTTIWWNISHSLIEHLRVIGRRCLRTFAMLSISPETNYTNYIPCNVPYEVTDILRIDLIITKLTRG